MMHMWGPHTGYALEALRAHTRGTRSGRGQALGACTPGKHSGGTHSERTLRVRIWPKLAGAREDPAGELLRNNDRLLDTVSPKSGPRRAAIWSPESAPGCVHLECVCAPRACADFGPVPGPLGPSQPRGLRGRSRTSVCADLRWLRHDAHRYGRQGGELQELSQVRGSEEILAEMSVKMAMKAFPKQAQL